MEWNIDLIADLCLCSGKHFVGFDCMSINMDQQLYFEESTFTKGNRWTKMNFSDLQEIVSPIAGIE